MRLGKEIRIKNQPPPSTNLHSSSSPPSLYSLTHSPPRSPFPITIYLFLRLFCHLPSSSFLFLSATSEILQASFLLLPCLCILLFRLVLLIFIPFSLFFPYAYSILFSSLSSSYNLPYPLFSSPRSPSPFPKLMYPSFNPSSLFFHLLLFPFSQSHHN